MPKRLQCNRCEAKPRIGGKEKLGKMNDLCVDCAVELTAAGQCPCCGNPLTDHTDKCVTQKTVDISTPDPGDPGSVEDAVAASV